MVRRAPSLESDVGILNGVERGREDEDIVSSYLCGGSS